MRFFALLKKNNSKNLKKGIDVVTRWYILVIVKRQTTFTNTYKPILNSLGGSY